MPALQGRWCPSCGGGVGWEDVVCPHCALPLEASWEQPDDAAPVAEAEPRPAAEAALTTDAEETRSIPRIESAIPPEDDPTSKVQVQDEMPRAGRLVLAAVFSAALVGGLALAITHPWDPDRNSIRATTEADTSMAGFPGTVEALSGQDSDAEAAPEVLSGDDATYASLARAYEKLGSYASRADENEALFDEVAYDGTAEDRERGRRKADILAIDVSNLIDELGMVDVSSGTYAQERDNLLTLGNWLRNRVDVLSEAWHAAAAGEPDRELVEQIVAKDRDAEGQSAYGRLFDEHYEGWKPEKAKG